MTTLSLSDPVSAGWRAGQWPGGGVRKQPVGSLFTRQEGRPTWQPVKKGEICSHLSEASHLCFYAEHLLSDKDNYLCNYSQSHVTCIPALLPQSAHSHNPSHQSHNTMIVTSSSSSSATTPHRVVGQQGYDGMMNKGGQYNQGMQLSVVPSGGPGQYQGNMSQGIGNKIILFLLINVHKETFLSKNVDILISSSNPCASH